MTFKAYNTWNNMVNRKQRSLDEASYYVEFYTKRLEEAKQTEGERTEYYIKRYTKEVRSYSKKAEKLEAELKVIMENIPEDVQSEINQRKEIFVTFSKLISFLEETWNKRDEMLKRACDEWLDEEMRKLNDSWTETLNEKRKEFSRMAKTAEYKTYREKRKAEETFLDEMRMKYYYEPRNVLLSKAGFYEVSEYERVSENSLEDLKKMNLENAQQSVLNLVERVENRVGKVTDWSDIHFGMNGMLNGRVTGNLGSVYVETIGAGGYNIQRFHYRVLLK